MNEREMYENILKKALSKFKPRPKTKPSDWKTAPKKGNSTITTNTKDDPFLEEQELEEEGGGDGGGGDVGQGGGGSYGSPDSITYDRDDATFWAGKQTGKKKNRNPLTTGLTSQGGNKYKTYEELVKEELAMKQICIEAGFGELYEREKARVIAEARRLKEYDKIIAEMYDDFEKRRGHVMGKVGDAEKRKGEFAPKPDDAKRRREMDKKLIDLIGGHEDADKARRAIDTTVVGPRPRNDTGVTKNERPPQHTLEEDSFSENPDAYVKAAVKHLLDKGAPKAALSKVVEYWQEEYWEGIVVLLKGILGGSKAEGYQGLFPILNYAAKQAGTELKPDEFKGERGFGDADQKTVE